MNIVLFLHAFTSCWNNGNAHFLRGVVRELGRHGHAVTVWEPESGWSRVNALVDGGAQSLAEAERLVPGARICRYGPDANKDALLDAALDGADLVLVHEWNEPALVEAIGERRRSGAFRLFFHDTHHRALTAPAEIDRFDLDHYDGVLAFGEALREIYRRRGWGVRAYTWHEAADTALFRPQPAEHKDCDVVWIGNWGDEERTRELHEYLIEPVGSLNLRGRVHGVRYPDAALQALRKAGMTYASWLPNHRVPTAFARAKATVHVPRQAYARTLVGIPTIRVFEALACGIPLVSSPWSDTEQLFLNRTYLLTANGAAMKTALRAITHDAALAEDLSRRGLAAILAAHTCVHRAEQLLAIVASLDGNRQEAKAAAAQRMGAAP